MSAKHEILLKTMEAYNGKSNVQERKLAIIMIAFLTYLPLPVLFAAYMFYLLDSGAEKDVMRCSTITP